MAFVSPLNTSYGGFICETFDAIEKRDYSSFPAIFPCAIAVCAVLYKMSYSKVVGNLLLVFLQLCITPRLSAAIETTTLK